MKGSVWFLISHPPEPGTTASRSLKINGKAKNGKTEVKCKRQSIPLCRFNFCRFAVLYAFTVSAFFE
jgi:hypothetical protein